MPHLRRILSAVALFAVCYANAQESRQFTFRSNGIELVWKQTDSTGFVLGSFIDKGAPMEWAAGEGSMNITFSADKPDMSAIPEMKALFGATFREGIDKHAVKEFDRVLNPVSFNRAGSQLRVFPTSLQTSNDSLIIFSKAPHADLRSRWYVQRSRAGAELMISTTLTATESGYHSMSSSSLRSINGNRLKWATVPGYFQGASINPDLVLSYGYGHGIPAEPVVLRDRNATTLTSIVTDTKGITIAASAERGYGRDAWKDNKESHQLWKLGLGVVRPGGDITPTLYYPVLGQEDSYLKKGESVTFAYRITISASDWYTMLQYVINQVNDFSASTAMRRNTRQSLTDRIAAMSDYVKDDKTSLWNEETFQGMQIGAQSYLGGVTGADRDAMKNSDYGAMWMMSAIADDSILARTRLPYARNFKLVQQQTDSGFFRGAAIGQYYLKKSKRFVEEWGNYVEPIAITYYTMLDIGNVLLFNPSDTLLRRRLRIGADKLLSWQKADGSWEVAYEKTALQPAFIDIRDLRPTFYGLLVAYRLLGDQKYLTAAIRGADWLIKEAVDSGYFIGVCGDSRYITDFATAQTAQSLLDLYAFTKNPKHLEAAKTAARYYVGSIYTHPVSRDAKRMKGTVYEQWQLAQTGLSFEHGGNFGSATTRGPILLAGHAGLFVRMFSLTGDSLFLQMARAGAIGRDAFVEPKSSVATYYWNSMNAGPGPYPNHAWWQIGWIIDYLLSEASLRSEGKINFPAGFITPKVGPHQSYGFARGSIFGEPADLHLFPNAIRSSDPNVEILTAINGNRRYILLLNDIGTAVSAQISIDTKAFGKNVTTLYEFGKKSTPISVNEHSFDVNLKPYGLTVYVME